MNKDKVYTVYGINNAKAVLQSDKCIVQKIFLDYNGVAYKDSLIKRLISKDSKKYVINNISSANNEVLKNERRLQGIVVIFSFSGVKESVVDFFNNSTDNDCILILDQLEDPQNLGKIIRTAERTVVEKVQ